MTLLRPGEEVHFKGWARHVSYEDGARVNFLPESNRNVFYLVRDSSDIRIAQGICPLNSLGGFDGSFRIPVGANLGRAALILQLDEFRETPKYAPDQHEFHISEQTLELLGVEARIINSQ